MTYRDCDNDCGHSCPPCSPPTGRTATASHGTAATAATHEIGGERKRH